MASWTVAGDSSGQTTLSGSGGARITRLQAPSRITFGGAGNHAGVATDADKQARGLQPLVKGKSAAEEQNSEARFNSWTRNGAITRDVFAWSQTKDEAFVYVFVPAGTKGKNLQIVLNNETFSVATKDSKRMFVKGKLAFQIVEPEDEFDIDWEVVEIPYVDTCERDKHRDRPIPWYPGRAVKVCMRKQEVPGGISVILWWTKVFETDATVDSSAFPDRKRYEKSNSVWKEAHELFAQSHADGEASKQIAHQ
jgi:hypothetical protein